eukprot:6344559-Prorocentrum_lima.AAC.1
MAFETRAVSKDSKTKRADGCCEEGGKWVLKLVLQTAASPHSGQEKTAGSAWGGGEQAGGKGY